MKSRIGEWIDKRGLKNKFVAHELGVTQEMVSKWRNDKSYPRVDKLFKLAKMLNVKVDDLYQEDEENH